MANTKVETVIKCDTVGDLLNELSAIAKNPELSGVLDSNIESYDKVFFGFKIVRETLSDKSEVLNFEFFEDQP